MFTFFLLNYRVPVSLQNAHAYIFLVCSSQQSCKIPKNDLPEVTQVVSGGARSNLWSNDLKFHVLPAVPGHLPGAEGVIKILLRKKDEVTLDNLGAKERKLSSL